jgi:hypothetical protein
VKFDVKGQKLIKKEYRTTNAAKSKDNEMKQAGSQIENRMLG